MSTRTRAVATLLLCLPFSLQAQEFDAISIKPNASGARERSLRAMPGQIVAVNVPVRQLIWNAYNMPDFMVVGGPEWIASDRFDVTAKSEKNPISPDDLRAMLRNALASRFKLRARLVTEERPMYALVLARPDGALGPQLRRVPGPCDPAQPQRQCGFSFNGNRLASNAATIPRLVQELRGIAERHVVDRTGLEGLYEIVLQWSPEQTADGPSLFTALQEQLGLKLEAERGPVQVLMIDGIERPTEN